MTDTPTLGTLELVPALDRPDLLAPPVEAAIHALDPRPDIWVAPIDASLADTAAFCEAYSVGLEISANCVVIAGRRGGATTYAACMVLATARADVNGVIRKHLGARKASFAPMDDAVAQTSMEYGGITPLGLPSDWPVLVDAQVEKAGLVVIGSGVRRSKLVLPASVLTALRTAEVIDLAVAG